MNKERQRQRKRDFLLSHQLLFCVLGKARNYSNFCFHLKMVQIGKEVNKKMKKEIERQTIADLSFVSSIVNLGKAALFMRHLINELECVQTHVRGFFLPEFLSASLGRFARDEQYRQQPFHFTFFIPHESACQVIQALCTSKRTRDFSMRRSKQTKFKRGLAYSLQGTKKSLTKSARNASKVQLHPLVLLKSNQFTFSLSNFPRGV